MSKALIYDIETIPQSDAALALMEPEHEAPGNIKDPDKIAAALREKSIKWKEKAALSPLTGRVAMIGLKCLVEPDMHHLTPRPDSTDEELDAQESELLRGWWNCAAIWCHSGNPLISFNGHGFDIPFLVKRSWSLGVEIPAGIGLNQMGTRGLSRPWIDLMQEFTMRDRNNPYVSLNVVSRFFGLGQKDGDHTQIRQQLESDPETALRYLRQDLLLTEGIARRMGFSGGEAPRTPAAVATDY